MSNSDFIYQKPLRTHKRLGEVIDQYNEYIDTLEKHQGEYHKINTPSGSPGAVVYKPNYEYYHFQVSPAGITRTQLGNVPSALIQGAVVSWSPYTNLNTTNYWLMDVGKIEQEFQKNYQTTVSQTNTQGFICNITSEMDSILDIKNQELAVYTSNTSSASSTIPSSNTPATSFNTISIDDIFSSSRNIQTYLDSCIANRKMTNIGTSSSYTINDISFQLPVMGPTINSTSLQDKYSQLYKGFSTVPNINNVSSYVCTEITTNIKVDTSQYYNLVSSVPQNNYFMLWVGDNAVAEYMYKNSDLNDKTIQKTMFFEKGVYYFIRIQVYSYIPSNSFINKYAAIKSTLLPSFTFQCVPSSSSSIVAPSSSSSSPIVAPSSSSSIFYSSLSSTNTSTRLYSYLPTLLYTSFVSDSPQSYSLGEFQCFTQLDANNNIEYSQLSIMYGILEAFKYGIVNGTYDTYNGLTQNGEYQYGQDQYGKLPNGIYYTLSQNGPSTLPVIFYLYRLNADKRMGNTYQINTIKDKYNQYEMVSLPDQFLAQSNDFSEYSYYYPTQYQIKNAIDTQLLQNGNPDECKQLCAQDSNCNFFYNFGLNNSSDTQAQKCYLDSGISQPSFNQINPNISQTENIQPGSSNLYIRDQQFSDEVKNICKETGKEKSVDIQIQALQQTTSYESSFPYSNYYINNSVKITDPMDIEICANKKKIQQFNNCFKEILQKDMTYNSEGDIVEGDSACTFLKEGFQNQIKTNAVQNTQEQGIDYINQQKKEFESNMDQVSNNYNEITNELIPEYEKSLKKVEESGYTELQNKNLINFGPTHLNAVQQSIKDNNERYVNMNLMFVLAILTVVILIVFIYTME